MESPLKCRINSGGANENCSCLKCCKKTHSTKSLSYRNKKKLFRIFKVCQKKSFSTNKPFTISHLSQNYELFFPLFKISAHWLYRSIGSILTDLYVYTVYFIFSPPCLAPCSVVSHISKQQHIISTLKS